MNKLTTDVIYGSDNVFADLGLPDASAELIKAELTYQIGKQIKRLGLTRAAAANRLGISQADASRLIKCRPTDFASDRLLGILNALGLDIDIVLRPATGAPQATRVRVVEELT